MRTLCILFGLLAICPAMADDSPQEWSRSVKGISGRLLHRQKDGYIQLTVELRNEDSLPLWVVAHDPFAFDLKVKDSQGKEVPPDAERADILSSPIAAILARECYMGLPVTLSPGAEERWNLDITTKLWALKPGRYRLAGKYMIPGEEKELKMKGAAYPWHGEIVLPEVEIEIR